MIPTNDAVLMVGLGLGVGVTLLCLLFMIPFGPWGIALGVLAAAVHMVGYLGLSGAVISAVDLVRGIGVYAGLEIIRVPGATGYLDTNYEGKGEYALKSLQEEDFVFVHVASERDGDQERIVADFLVADAAHQILRAAAVLGHVAQQHVSAVMVDGAHDTVDIMRDARLLDAENRKLALNLVAAKCTQLTDHDGQLG